MPSLENDDQTVTNNIQAPELPHNIRLIAAISRLVDLHQTRRDDGVYVPEIPDRAGYYLTLGLTILDCLRELELERGTGNIPTTLLASVVRKRIAAATDQEIELCVANLKTEREVHYGTENGDGSLTMSRTWDSTPLLTVADGFSQVQLTDNAHLLMRVASLSESWLYSDLDADRLNKAITRGQFGDIPNFCKAMTLDLAAKNKQLSRVMERPSLSELRELLTREGPNISESLINSTEIIQSSIELIFDDRCTQDFAIWAERERPDYALGNLRAELELVLQNAEALSRRFNAFMVSAQKVRQQGAARIKFLEISRHLVYGNNPNTGKRLEALLRTILPTGVHGAHFHPGMLVGKVDFRVKEITAPPIEFTVNPDTSSAQSRFYDFILRNRDHIIGKLQQGPLLLSQLLTSDGYQLLPGESVLDLFGVYGTPDLLEDDEISILVGMGEAVFEIEHQDTLLSGNDPFMVLEKKS